MAKGSRMWDSLLQLTGQLVEGKSVLEDLVAESPNAALDRGFSMKRKRSPRNHNNQERGGVILEKKSGSPNFKKKKKKSGCHEKNPKRRRRRCFEELGESSPKESEVNTDSHVIIIDSNNNIQSSGLPAVPEAIKSRIIETGGRVEGAVCVIEKALFRTDVDTTKSRLSVPLRQVRERFLFPGDKDRLLSDGEIRTMLILPSPCFEEYSVLFGLWESNKTYVLKNGWNEVIEGNDDTLRDGRVIRLWAFRRKSDDLLCFALQLL